MQYFSAPMLSASFTPQGKKVKQRLENILTKNKKHGYFLPMCALALLMAGTFVACASAQAADTPATPTDQAPEILVATRPELQTQVGDQSPASAEPEISTTPVQYAPPLSGNLTILSAFGERAHPITGVVAIHHGVDLTAEEGTPVLATADGTVTKAEYKAVYGHHVILTHADGSTSLYGHMQSLAVDAGQTVTAGEALGLTGQSGWATGPHLHFELRDAEGAAMDPTNVVS